MSLWRAFQNQTGYDVYTCDKCGTQGRTPDNTGLPNGWTEGLFGSGHYCPRCTAKREAKDAERDAKNQAKRAAKKAAQAAYDATPEGKKERNIAALSAVAAVLLFFLFIGVFHLTGVAFIVGFIAGAPFFWFRARKTGFVILVLLLLVIVGKFNTPENIDKGDEASAAKNSEVISENNLEKETKLKISQYLAGVEDINNSAELSQFYFDIASKFYNNEMGFKGTQEQINAGNELMVGVYTFLGRSARKNSEPNIDSMQTVIQNFDQVSNFRKKKALDELQLGINKINEID